jgi:hypothetical protein
VDRRQASVDRRADPGAGRPRDPLGDPADRPPIAIAIAGRAPATTGAGIAIETVIAIVIAIETGRRARRSR